MFPILAAVGLCIYVLTGIMLIAKAFKVGIWWGLGFTTLPVLGGFFLYRHWGDTKRIFLLHLAGLAMAAVGYGVAEGF